MGSWFKSSVLFWRLLPLLSVAGFVCLWISPPPGRSVSQPMFTELWQNENICIMWWWSQGVVIFDPCGTFSNADWRLSLSCSWLTGRLPAPGEIHCLTITLQAGLTALKIQYIIYFNLWSIDGNCFSEIRFSPSLFKAIKHYKSWKPWNVQRKSHSQKRRHHKTKGKQSQRVTTVFYFTCSEVQIKPG